MAWFNRKRYGYVRMDANRLVGLGYSRSKAWKIAWSSERDMARRKVKRPYGLGY